MDSIPDRPARSQSLYLLSYPGHDGHIYIYIYMYINENSIPEEIKSRLKSGNACCHSVQNFFSSRLLSKNLETKIYRTIILPIVLYGCETWSLTLREERKLRVFENMEENIWT